MIWLGAILCPLAAALALGPRATERLAARWLIPLSGVPALALALWKGADAGVRYEWLLLGSEFGFGEMGRVLLFLTALLWTCAGVYAAGYLAEDPRRRRFFIFFALSMSGNLGLAVAQDVASFYLFFSLMTFSAYGLVVHQGDAEAYRAGRIYLIAAIFGEMLLLAAALLAVWESQTVLFSDLRPRIAHSPLHGVVILLAFVGFGVKAGAAFVHFWLPLAHPVAPVPASAVLSGAMIKAGLLGWTHFLPFGTGAYPAWAALLIAAGYLAAFGAVAMGLAQRDPKTVLAYSSVSQMGVITAIMGVALMDAALWPLMLPAVSLFALNHALAKGALFLGVGMAARARSGTARGLVLAGVALAAAAIAGAPYTGGAVAKHAAKYATGGLEAGVLDALPMIMSASSVATTLLLARFVALIARGETGHAASSIAPAMLVSWSVLMLAVAAAVPWSIGWFAMEVDPDNGFWSAAGPVLIGIALFALAAPLVRGRGWAIPAGDIVVLLEALARRAATLMGRLRLRGPLAWQVNLVDYVDSVAATERRRDLSRRLELRLLRWENAMALFVGVILALMGLLWH
jgi:formate hydrogenlyase subunit 3/multisubunit Na+/H+ antiporter MnhD subunit